MLSRVWGTLRPGRWNILVPKTNYLGIALCLYLGGFHPEVPYMKEPKLEVTHCKSSPFDKQFCMANAAIFTSYIPFQNYPKKIFQSKEM
jgi:hypothetical protein